MAAADDGDTPTGALSSAPLATGGLAPALAAARPIDDVEAQRVRAAARAALFGDGEPVRVGRFTLLERLGAGAMGVVYAAWDPQLDRKVALKLVQPQAASVDGRARLLAEARAAARLAHPAVVTVFDAGEHGDEVWIAMEFVAGRSLRSWATTSPRWPAVVAIARQVAAGLAAAHQAGLLHRDVKPDNILIDDRGASPRAWIADFGLAIRQDGADAASGSGTPAYMAPEQHAGGPASAASDQFALGLTFLEVLDGHHPFASEPAAVAAAVQLGELRAPRRREAPAWVRDVLVRAVAAQPAARWPSVEALAARLARDPRSARRRVAIGAALVAVGTAAGALALPGRAPPRPAPCVGAADALDAVWPAQRGAVDAALAAVARPWAAGTRAATLAALDRFATDWRSRRVEVCRASVVRHQQSAELMDLRAACLERIRVRAGALVTALAQADAAAAERAVAAIAALPALATCDDELALRRSVPLPDAPRAASYAATLGAQVAAARAAIALGRPAPGLPIVRVATATLGWGPLVAEAEHVTGQAAEARGDHAAAVAHYQRALYQALAARGDRAAADAALRLLWVEGFWRRQPEAADRWDREATALIAAAGDPYLAAVQEDHRGVRAALAGDLSGAAARHRRALAGLIAARGDADPATLNPRINLAVALVGLERLDEAAALLDQVRADATRLLGEGHPTLGPVITNRAVIAWRQRQYDRARADFEAALAIKEATLGPTHVGLASTLGNLAAVMAEQGEVEASLPLLARVIALVEATDAMSPRLIDPLVNLALAELELGRPTAPATTTRLVAVALRAAGDGGRADPSMFFPLVLAGWATLEAGDPRGAVRALAPLLAHPGYADAMAGEQLELVRALAVASHRGRAPAARVRALLAQAGPLVTAEDLAPHRQAEVARELAALAATYGR
ncbi:MAG: serine/threonine protein kinase [Myxococcales bacterium]|nr:serine/threonine protein kinase [Myxococcales bacterium]MBK7196434.1 serine/threonine protein kinase [Myxococcales bacterium]MBP6842635.1 serine/threonine protein kinase [Kofleriaceae bacterium]